MIFNIKNILRNLSQENKLFNKIYLFANRVKVNALSNLSDEKFAKIKYKENTGRKLNLENPKTFGEKLWWLKLNNRDPLLTICSDKVKVREYVEKQGLGHILTEIYGVYNDADEINFDKLPNKAYIKTNHGSGGNIVWDKSNPFDIKKFRKQFNKNLKQNYYLQSREWNYKNIKPKILIEEVLEDKKKGYLTEFRFFCFDGIARIIFVNIETANKDGSKNPIFKRNAYDRDFNPIEIKGKGGNFNKDLVKKPSRFDEMISYAETLSKEFPHCRVDFYYINDKIYFGEITFYHGGGSQLIEPEELDLLMGDYINLDSKKIIFENEIN